MIVKMRNIDEVVILDIEGDLARTAIPEPTLHQLVKAQLASGKSKILLNCEKVNFVDSFGVGEIIASYIDADRQKAKLRVCFNKEFMQKYKVVLCPQPHTLAFIVDSEESALESFEKGQ